MKISFMQRLSAFFIPLLIIGAIGYICLAVSGCGARVDPKAPAGKIYSSNKY